MTQRTTCYVLRFHTSNVAVYSNLLHAYTHLKKVTPERTHRNIPAYRTIIRRLGEVGNIEEIKTAQGTYYIEHHDITLRCMV
jgi:hypothetical protein